MERINRLTIKNDEKYFNENIRCLEYNDYEQFIKDRPYRIDYCSIEVETKLGKLEDLMEQNNIDSIKELEEIIQKGLGISMFLTAEWKKGAKK